MALVRTARLTGEDPKAKEGHREALESAVLAEASKADPLWGRKPAALRREGVMARARGEVRAMRYRFEFQDVIQDRVTHPKVRLSN